MSATMPLTVGFTAGAPRRTTGKAAARVDRPAAAAPSSSAADRGHADAAHDIAAWVRHAEAANGFGGDATPVSPLSYRLLFRARANRSAHVGALIAAAVAKVVSAAREASAWYRRRRESRAMRRGLHELDDRTLRDIGFSRSEIESVIAEATGGAEWTRLRTRWLQGQ